MRNKLNIYLNTLISNGGSDLHLKSGASPRVRIDGLLKKLGKDILLPEMITDIISEIISEEQYAKLQADKSLDTIYILGEEHRFRVNVFHQMDGLSAVFRVIPVKILTLEELNLPSAIEKFTTIQRGLVLVTGVTGSGKSTTLAALLDKLNVETNKHIITIEDPIEFVHKDKGCLINQRAIGQDTHSFSDALRAALREDPDIILVGEMRDLETIEIAIHAANTGHLVFSTLHTLDAKETIDRIIGMFSKNEQNRIRTSLASVLEGVISQRLVPSLKGGRQAAVEILKKTARIEQLIRENNDNEIIDALRDGKGIYGTQTFDQSLLDLFHNGTISRETTLEYATNPADVKLKLDGVGENSIAQGRSTAESAPIFTFKDDN